MKKVVGLTALLALVLMVGSIGMVQAEILPPHGEGQIGLEATVLCEELTVREAPNVGAKAVETVKYGAPLSVVEQSNGWAKVFTSDDVDAEAAGWVNADYIAIDPAWYSTEGKTPVYAWNSTSAPKVALLADGAFLPILKDDGEWLVVSLRGASGWIHK